MRAVRYNRFRERPELAEVADPEPVAGGVVLAVRASGVCLSDWHGWQGHDSMISLPHVPGHELAGVIEAMGPGVAGWQVGDRVTVPFVCGCGACPQCDSGHPQVCDQQFQPGFSHWGSFAEYVGVHYAEHNLVRLPDDMDFDAAASLGCRFATAFRAIVDQGRLKESEWLAVHGCGGVGLSAVMIAHAIGAQVLAIDIADEPLREASSLGAAATLNVREAGDAAAAIRDLTDGGPHVSLDAIGRPEVVALSLASLRKRGRHIQVGLIAGPIAGLAPAVEIAMPRVISDELEIRGSHGMQAYRYDAMLGMIRDGRLVPERLIRRRISLEQSIEALTTMDRQAGAGVTVITQFV